MSKDLLEYGAISFTSDIPTESNSFFNFSATGMILDSRSYCNCRKILRFTSTCRHFDEFLSHCLNIFGDYDSTFKRKKQFLVRYMNFSAPRSF